MLDYHKNLPYSIELRRGLRVLSPVHSPPFSPSQCLWNLQSTDPADISHSSLHSLHMKLGFEADRQSMKWTYGLSVLVEILVELFCLNQGVFEEDFVQTIILGL